MQTLLPDTRIQRSCIPSDCAGGERMLSRVYGRLECRCYSDYLPKACSLGWDCPAVPSASCSQMWSELSNLPIDSWTTNPFSPSAFGCTRRIGLQSSISVHNRNQIEDWVIPFSAHYLSLAETQNTHKPFMTKPADKSYGTCWGQQSCWESSESRWWNFCCQSSTKVFHSFKDNAFGWARSAGTRRAALYWIISCKYSWRQKCYAKEPYERVETFRHSGALLCKLLLWQLNSIKTVWKFIAGSREILRATFDTV